MWGLSGRALGVAMGLAVRLARLGIIVRWRAAGVSERRKLLVGWFADRRTSDVLPVMQLQWKQESSCCVHAEWAAG